MKTLLLTLTDSQYKLIMIIKKAQFERSIEVLKECEDDEIKRIRGINRIRDAIDISGVIVNTCEEWFDAVYDPHRKEGKRQIRAEFLMAL